MRKYSNEELNEINCNVCGRKMKVKAGIIQEGCFHVDYPWGYFSKKDGMIHHFDLCEECYDKWTGSFILPVQEAEANGLL